MNKELAKGLLEVARIQGVIEHLWSKVEEIQSAGSVADCLKEMGQELEKVKEELIETGVYSDEIKDILEHAEGELGLIVFDEIFNEEEME